MVVFLFHYVCPLVVIEVIHDNANHIVISRLGCPELSLKQSSGPMLSPMERSLFLVVSAAGVRSGV